MRGNPEVEIPLRKLSFSSLGIKDLLSLLLPHFAKVTFVYGLKLWRLHPGDCSVIAVCLLWRTINVE